MIRTQILLTPTLYELFKMKAQEEGKSLSVIVRQAVEKLLRPKKKTGGEILLEMAKHAGSNPKAPKDLATNDEYLYGKKAHYGNIR